METETKEINTTQLTSDQGVKPSLVIQIENTILEFKEGDELKQALEKVAHFSLDLPKDKEGGQINQDGGEDSAKLGETTQPSTSDFVTLQKQVVDLFSKQMESNNAEELIKRCLSTSHGIVKPVLEESTKEYLATLKQKYTLKYLFSTKNTLLHLLGIRVLSSKFNIQPEEIIFSLNHINFQNSYLCLSTPINFKDDIERAATSITNYKRYRIVVYVLLSLPIRLRESLMTQIVQLGLYNTIPRIDHLPKKLNLLKQLEEEPDKEKRLLNIAYRPHKKKDFFKTAKYFFDEYPFEHNALFFLPGENRDYDVVFHKFNNFDERRRMLKILENEPFDKKTEFPNRLCMDEVAGTRQATAQFFNEVNNEWNGLPDSENLKVYFPDSTVISTKMQQEVSVIKVANHSSFFKHLKNCVRSKKTRSRPLS